MSHWHWQREESRTQSMAGARPCRAVWHLQSPRPDDFAARLFAYADGEVTLYIGNCGPHAQMTFIAGHGGPGRTRRYAIAACMQHLRDAWAMHLAKSWAHVD